MHRFFNRKPKSPVRLRGREGWFEVWWAHLGRYIVSRCGSYYIIQLICRCHGRAVFREWAFFGQLHIYFWTVLVLTLLRLFRGDISVVVPLRCLSLFSKNVLLWIVFSCHLTVRPWWGSVLGLWSFVCIFKNIFIFRTAACVLPGSR